MKAFLKKKMFNKSLAVEDLIYLSRLLKSSMSISDCFSLIENRNNQGLLKEISAELDHGSPIEKALNGRLPDKLKDYLLPLSQRLSFSEALDLSLDFYDLDHQGRKELLSGVAYPLGMLFITITTLYLFDLYGMDTIFRVIGSFSAQEHFYQGFRVILRLIVNGIYYLSLILTAAVLFYTRPKRVVLFYLFISRYLPDSLLNSYYSEKFMSLFVVCIDRGYPTKQSLEILKSMKTMPIISFLAFHLDESLLSGETLKDAVKKRYYDHYLARFIRIASYTNDFSRIIMSYVEMARMRIRNKLRLYAATLQLLTYGFIGLIVIFIYQILFLPMQAISIL